MFHFLILHRKFYDIKSTCKSFGLGWGNFHSNRYAPIFASTGPSLKFHRVYKLNYK